MNLDVAAILIKKAALEFDKMANSILEEHGLTIAQYKVLKYIYSEYKSGVRIVDLENYYSMTHPTAIGLVSALEKNGMVEFHQNPNNVRSRFIYPTQAALEKREELEKIGNDLEARFTTNLTEEERLQLVSLLRKMLYIE